MWFILWFILFYSAPHARSRTLRWSHVFASSCDCFLFYFRLLWLARRWWLWFWFYYAQFKTALITLIRAIFYNWAHEKFKRKLRLKLISVFSFRGRMGAHMKASTVGTEQDFKVVKIIAHSSYHSPLRYSHDIALIKLERPAILNKAVGLVCVPDGNSPAMPIDSSSKKCWITGWGRLAAGGASPDRLMQASVPLVSKARY